MLYGSAFVIGAVLYPLLELLWRGRTHITMAFVGGICLCLIYSVNEKLGAGTSLYLRALLCSAAITGVEFVSGCLFNIVLRLRVWDYSAHMFNLLGQICLLYSVLWFILCIPLCAVCTRAARLLHRADAEENIDDREIL